jgi:hypothetical protein
MVRYACDSPLSWDALSRSLPGDFDIPPVLVLNSRIVPALHVTRSIEHDLGFATHSHA